MEGWRHHECRRNRTNTVIESHILISIQVILQLQIDRDLDEMMATLLLIIDIIEGLCTESSELGTVSTLVFRPSSRFGARSWKARKSERARVSELERRGHRSRKEVDRLGTGMGWRSRPGEG